MKKKYFVLFASILAFSLAAQTSLSLQDCLELAKQNNKNLLKAKEDVAIYRQEYNHCLVVISSSRPESRIHLYWDLNSSIWSILPTLTLIKLQPMLWMLLSRASFQTHIPWQAQFH